MPSAARRQTAALSRAHSSAHPSPRRGHLRCPCSWLSAIPTSKQMARRSLFIQPDARVLTCGAHLPHPNGSNVSQEQTQPLIKNLKAQKKNAKYYFSVGRGPYGDHRVARFRPRLCIKTPTVFKVPAFAWSSTSTLKETKTLEIDVLPPTSICKFIFVLSC